MITVRLFDRLDPPDLSVSVINAAVASGLHTDCPLADLIITFLMLSILFDVYTRNLDGTCTERIFC